MSDKVGGYITESTGNLLKLQSFNRYVTTNKLINEDSSGIVDTVKENIETIRTELKKLTGVKTYETVKARLETFEREALAEDDTSSLKDLFTIRRFDEKFEEVLPIVKQLVQERDTFHKRIEEAAANVVMLRREAINTVPMFEFAGEHAKLGFKLNELALRILENEELAGFVNKIGTKLCKEGQINDFEKAVLTQVLENVQVAEKTESTKKEIKESADLSIFFDKYTMNFY
jgi:predicted phage tail protein